MSALSKEDLPVEGRYSDIRIPALSDDVDSMTAAFAYAAAGLYVGPLDQGTKHPGSVLGGRWETKTFSDAQSVAAWYSGANYGVFLHAGRSGLVILDVDKPDRIPEAWWPILASAPFQSTRSGLGRRGHYIFAMPAGRAIGNPNIPNGAGEVRGTNGVIVVAPTVHELAGDGGGQYRWVRSGPIPILPRLIADTFGDGRPGESAVTDSQIATFLSEHVTDDALMEQLRVEPISDYTKKVAAGSSRHAAAITSATWIAREVAAGWYRADVAFDTLEAVFRSSFTVSERAAGRGSAHEWSSIVAWAIGQAIPDAVAAKRQQREERWRHVTPIDQYRSLPPGSLPDPNAILMMGGDPRVPVVPNGSVPILSVPIPAPQLYDAEEESAARELEARTRFNLQVAEQANTDRVRRAARRLLDEEEAAASLATSDFSDEYLTCDQLASLPRPEPMIEGVLARHSTIILRGRDHTYKSFVAIDWSLCVATGRPWQGRPTSQGRVLYVMGEGAFGATPRIAAWRAARGVVVPSDAFVVRRSAVNLFRGGAAYEDLLRRVSEGGFSLVVLDTLRRVSGGADGNGSDMGVVIDRIAELREATAEGSILTVAHTDKGDNDTRGYSGIEDDTDIIWHSKRDEDARPFTLKNTKNKNAPDGEELSLDVRTQGDSLVIDTPIKGTKVTEPEGSVRHRILNAVRENCHTGVSWSTLEDSYGFSKTSLSRHLNSLIGDDHVEKRNQTYYPKGNGDLT